jgi:hyperosmotically inducible periplasmic protein
MKRSMLIILTIVTIISVPITNSVRASMISSSVSAQKGSTQDRTMVNLTKEVRHELLMLPYYSVFDWLQFDVKSDGTVTLSGQVTRPTLKSDAENDVKRIEGVEDVVNQIEVLPLSPNDDRIRRAVYRTIFNYNSPLFRYSMGAVPPIHIIVKNGHVTLKGSVSSQADANLAYMRARGVPGIFSVKNELEADNY